MMKILHKKNDKAVSPVVGVMLMLVVTIIIAAVVSAYAGGMTKGEQKAPVLSMESHVVNDGTWGGSYLDLAVMSVDQPIPTKDLKLITSWKATDGTKGGVAVTGPNNTVGSVANTHVGTTAYHSPLGYGNGVNQSVTTSSNGPGGNFYPDQMFGNFTLTGGTRMHNVPYGSSTYGGYGVSADSLWAYKDGSKYVYADSRDGMQAVLGQEWWHLRAGNIVTIKIVHIPSGKVIYNKDVLVEG
ncbi:MAG: type IV pilin N-terminal domain-containing protein [Methanoregula sp.]|nr:type IV pilin N-terminal domain-containing protein [Methanoregula sp.]